METKTITIRMNVELYESLARQSKKSLNQTIVDNLSNLEWFMLEATRDLGLKKFTLKELEFIGETYEPYYNHPESLAMVNGFYATYLEECIEKGLAKKYNIDTDRLINKFIFEMDSIHMKALFNWCEQHKKTGISFSDYEDELMTSN